jgi:hypothetical protein
MRKCGKDYGRTGETTDNDTAHAHCMPDNQGYRHKLRTQNSYSFCTGIVVTRTRLKVTFILTLSLLFTDKSNFNIKHNQKSTHL